MRVITGTARGRRLSTPTGLDTRPTGAKVKEAVMSAIQFEIEGARVLDLFAGSGQMGIEALSRGARSCVFVDNARASQDVLRDNLRHTGLADKARVVGNDAFAYLQTAAGAAGAFDIVFADPPYAAGTMPRLLNRLAPLVADNGAVFCETAKGEELPSEVGGLALFREYNYGKTKVTLYRKAETEAVAE